ncbi:MAG: FHA domain-containing protein [Anaerolineae bacterium]
MSNVPARLIVRLGPNPGAIFELTQESASIGRSAANDIVLADPEISRRHAQIIRQEDEYAIQDLGSTNGSFVNNQRVTGLTLLHHGDMVALGEIFTLEFQEGPAAEPAADAGSPFDTLAEATMMEAPPPAPPSPVPAAADSGVRTLDDVDDFAAPMPDAEPNCGRQFLACGCLFLLAVFACAAALFFLDAYEGGRLLYCGPLQPLFEAALGPFGFSPACALNAATGAPLPFLS